MTLGLAIAACGGGSGTGPPPPPAAIHTLAYVVSECHEGPGAFFKQSLQIRQGDRAPVTVMETPSVRPVVSGLCRLFGQSRFGPASLIGGAFQRLGVSPDGSIVVFEVSDDFSVLATNFLPPEQKGVFVVRADGTGLHRLGPASREANFRFDLAAPAGSIIYPLFEFSPSGRTFVFTDRGPGPTGEEAIQIVTQDVRTGQRKQVTQLPVAPEPPTIAGTAGPAFLNEQTIAFLSFGNPDGLNSDGNFLTFLVNSDGSGKISEPTLPPPVPLPGSTLVPTLSITGAQRHLSTYQLQGEPLNPMPGATQIQELFIDDGTNLLQLTHFGRVDTAPGYGNFLGADGQEVFFVASADPFGSNPMEDCQFFSIDSLGADLRQLTHFRSSAPSANGCAVLPPPGCTISSVNQGVANSQDPTTGTLVFYSSCDPLGTNPNGGQLFAMNPDGSGLRQLTSTRGVVTAADGSVDVELPGPSAYGPHFP